MAADTAEKPGANGADSALVGVPYVGDLDGRTKPARLFKITLAALIEDRGGAATMSNGELLLARRAAGAGTLCDSIEARILAGEDLGSGLVDSYLAATNTFRRLVVTLGLRRAAKDVTPPLSDYLAGKGEGAPR